MMSIRSLARDLYQAQQAVDALQKKHDAAAPDAQAALARELALARKDLQMLRRMLDGEKESGSFRQRFTGFGRTRR
jgi:hypothetical protein